MYFIFLLLLPAFVLATLPPLDFQLTRRHFSFPAPDTANLTFLLSALDSINARFNATILALHSDTLVREPRRLHGTQASSILLGEVGLEGSWFADLRIGTPVQQVDMDIDMLAADWWILSTTSGKGSWFLDFNSRTYRDSEKGLAFPTCREPSDTMYLPGLKEVEVTFAHCRPAKQWLRTLGPSGAHLGVAPGSSLSQTNTKGLLVQLLEKGVIGMPVFSLRLSNGTEGVLSIGGVAALRSKQADKRTPEDEEKGKWERNGTPATGMLPTLEGKETKHHETRRENGGRQMAMPESYSKESPAKDWKWNQVQGPEGWWQILMPAVWIGGRKVLHNQPMILDINTPFIFAPPQAIGAFYGSISGSRRLPAPFDQFYSYPCLNPPQVQLEFGQDWKVHVLKGKRDKGTFSPGGRFSLGRIATGSGYCVGIVVESRMKMKKSPADDANGLEDFWVLGEPFFRDCHVAFDWQEKKIGIQRL